MKKLVLALVLVLTASMTVAAAAGAHTGVGKLAVSAHAKKAVLHGKIAAIASDSLTLTLRNGSSEDVALTADTKFRVNGHRTTLANVRVGDRALVKVKPDGSARAVFAFFRSIVRGKVAAVGSDSITLTLRNGGSQTIEVTTHTKIRVNGDVGLLADIQVGFKAHVKLALDRTAKRIAARAVV